MKSAFRFGVNFSVLTVVSGLHHHLGGIGETSPPNSASKESDNSVEPVLNHEPKRHMGNQSIW